MLGVRCSSVALAEVVRTLFADRLASGAEPPPNLSVALAGPSDGGGRLLHRVYLGSSRVARTRGVKRLFDVVWHVLDAFDRVEQGARAQLRAMVLVSGDRAHVFPSAMRAAVSDAERAWRRDGFEPVDRPIVELELDGWDLVIPASGLAGGPSTFDGLQPVQANDEGDADERQPQGKFSIASWSPEAWVLSPAAQVVAAARAVENRELLGGREVVEHLARHLTSTPRAGLWENRAELGRWLSALESQAGF